MGDSSAAALLMLADGRLPGGGYAHSAGLETSIRLGYINNPNDLERFLAGRATTSGAVAAAFAARSCAAARREKVEELAELDLEFLARTPAPALKQVAQTLGRQLLRAVSAIHPHPLQEHLPRVLTHPVAFGACAAMLGVSPAGAALGVLQETVTGPAVAAVKLMSVDPFQAHRAIANLLPLIDRIAQQAAQHAETAPSELPSYSAPLSDVFGELHARQEVRLFAS